MLRAAGDQTSMGKNYGVSLIEWFELRHEVIIIMERPEDSQNLLDYINDRYDGTFSEDMAKVSVLSHEQ